MKVIIVGFGGVARAFAGLIQSARPMIRKAYALDIQVVGVADSRGSVVDPDGLDLTALVATKEKLGMLSKKTRSLDSHSLILETDADVMVELTHTNPQTGEPGLSNIFTALKRGMSAVTANKGPLVVDYEGVMRAATRTGAMIRYSAAAGGGTPVLAFGEECAKVERIGSIEAALNWTSNYIMTRMESSRSVSFSAAVREAQRRGIAERDPALDIDGIETACEMVIIANHVLKMNSRLSDVRRIEGIRGVTPERIRRSNVRGRVWRLVGIIERDIQVRVVELDANDPLAVKGARDATRYQCEYSGPKIVGSLGGTPLDTATGILRDVVDIGRARINKA